MIRLDITVDDITEVVAAGYTVIRVYTDTSESGSFATLDGTETLVAGQTGYSYVDLDGTTSTWYKVSYYGSVPGESSKSSAQQGGTIDAYATALDVRAELASGSGSATIGQEHEDTLWEMLVEASRLIDQYKGVEPGAYMASGSETRYFAGSGLQRQFIECAVSISAVAVEETDGTYTSWVDNTDYYAWPYNASAIGEPIRALEVVAKSGTTKSVFTRGQRRVRVAGVFGIASSPPSPIARACKIQAARWFKRAQQSWQDAGVSADSGQMQYVKKLDPDVETLLNTAFPHVGAGGI